MMRSNTLNFVRVVVRVVVAINFVLAFNFAVVDIRFVWGHSDSIMHSLSFVVVVVIVFVVALLFVADKGCAKKTLFQIFVLLISQLLFIGSLKFLCLPHIIRGTSWGVGTRILKI